MNKIFLLGRLTAAPEIRYTQTETKIVRYRLAVNRQYKKDGEQEADFLNCVCFGKNADFAEKYLDKGTQIIVIGRIQTSSYEKADGQKAYTTDIIVEQHEFCGGKLETQPTTEVIHTPPTTAENDLILADDDPDLPF